VLLLQPLFKCWTGRCSTCQQSIDAANIPLTPPARHDE
jgi:ferredoxin